MSEPLWKPTPERIAQANLTAFIRRVEQEWAVVLPDYQALYQWSITHPEQFWPAVWSFAGIRASRPWEVVARNLDRMPGTQWFVGAA